MPLDRELLAKAKAAFAKSAGEPGDEDKDMIGDYKKQIAEAKTPGTTAAAPKQEAPTPEQPWTPEQLLQFARMGLNPKRLQFMQSLAGLRKGMNLESELLDRALRGKLNQFGDEDSVLGGMPLGQFA